jgi:hypothetical protein
VTQNGRELFGARLPNKTPDSLSTITGLVLAAGLMPGAFIIPCSSGVTPPEVFTALAANTYGSAEA